MKCILVYSPPGARKLQSKPERDSDLRLLTRWDYFLVAGFFAGAAAFFDAEHPPHVLQFAIAFPP
jgi:hypothetical protein